jgi:hypothetical protein
MVRFRAVPVTSLEDATLNFEQLQTLDILNRTAENTLQTPTVSQPTRVLGTAYRPSTTRATLVTMVIVTSAVNSGAQFFSDAANPPTIERARVYGSGASGVQLPMTIMVLPGHYYLAGAIGTASVLETTEWTL